MYRGAIGEPGNLGLYGMLNELRETAEQLCGMQGIQHVPNKRGGPFKQILHLVEQSNDLVILSDRQRVKQCRQGRQFAVTWRSGGRRTRPKRDQGAVLQANRNRPSIAMNDRGAGPPPFKDFSIGPCEVTAAQKNRIIHLPDTQSALRCVDCDDVPGVAVTIQIAHTPWQPTPRWHHDGAGGIGDWHRRHECGRI